MRTTSPSFVPAKGNRVNVHFELETTQIALPVIAATLAPAATRRSLWVGWTPKRDGVAPTEPAPHVMPA